jgi:transposase
MFIRKKKNKSGKISVQIIDKSGGKYKVWKTLGCASEDYTIKQLVRKAERTLEEFQGQYKIEFHAIQESDLLKTFFDGVKDLRLAGPELLLNPIFEDVGYGRIKDNLFRYLVLSRLEFPVSKLRTVDYLSTYKGITIDITKVYRYMDCLHEQHIKQVQQIGYEHATGILTVAAQVLFYDVTTIYFEAEREDEFRKTGFSKEGKHQSPQILLGLLTNAGGFPLAYELFEGNKFEGHTMLPVLNAFRGKYNLKELVVVADAGLLSKKNIEELKEEKYKYILGARIKNTATLQKENILSLHLQDGQCKLLEVDEEERLIISYSANRAKKDKYNRERGLKKLEKLVKEGKKLGKQLLVKRGYNKYLQLSGNTDVKIDYDKFSDDARWDGLKGFQTNSELPKEEVIARYKELWLIEKAFRISKTDLRIRPIFHHIKRRIESHICISFAALVVYKELERRLKEKKSGLSAEKAIEIAKSIYELRIESSITKKEYCRLIVKNEEQAELLDLFGIPIEQNLHSDNF